MKACETVIYVYIKLDNPAKIFEAVFFHFFVAKNMGVGGFLPTLYMHFKYGGLTRDVTGSFMLDVFEWVFIFVFLVDRVIYLYT